mgnify:CR=1 FL=1
MPVTDTDLRCQVDELKTENERLRKQLAETRAQRAEYMQYISELLPPIELPSEEEMAEQIKRVADLKQHDRPDDDGEHKSFTQPQRSFSSRCS